MHRGGCLELYYCNMVEWSWWDPSLIWKTSWFSSVLWHCWFGLWPVKIVPEMTCNVSSGTLSLYTTTELTPKPKTTKFGTKKTETSMVVKTWVNYNCSLNIIVTNKFSVQLHCKMCDGNCNCQIGYWQFYDYVRLSLFSITEPSLKLLAVIIIIIIIIINEYYLGAVKSKNC